MKTAIAYICPCIRSSFPDNDCVFNMWHLIFIGEKTMTLIFMLLTWEAESWQTNEALMQSLWISVSNRLKNLSIWFELKSDWIMWRIRLNESQTDFLQYSKQKYRSMKSYQELFVASILYALTIQIFLKFSYRNNRTELFPMSECAINPLHHYNAFDSFDSDDFSVLS